MTGKVTAAAGSTTVTETRTINDLNQITYNTVVGATTVDWTFTYDNSGNLYTRSDGTNTTTYTWDEDNRLTLVTLPDTSTIAYTYDVLGRMLSRTDTSGTTTFVWDGTNCVMETDYLGNMTRYYIPNGMLMSFDRTVSAVTSTYQIHADALGSVRKVTDSSGTVQATFDYDAWGNQLASTSDSIPNGGLQYRFVGALGVRWDAATGLYYMRARWYDPQLACFLSRDRVRRSNRYTYARTNPVRFVDPSGNDDTDSWAGPSTGPPSPDSIWGWAGPPSPNPGPSAPNPPGIWPPPYLGAQIQSASLPGNQKPSCPCQNGTDFASASVSVGSGLYSYGGAVTMDQYYQWNFGPTASAGHSLLPVNFSFMYGNTYANYTPSQMQDFSSDKGASVYAGFGFGTQLDVSTVGGQPAFATEYGFMTPQFGESVTYMAPPSAWLNAANSLLFFCTP